MPQGLGTYLVKVFLRRFQLFLRCLMSLALAQPFGAIAFAMNPPVAVHSPGPLKSPALEPGPETRRKIARAYGGLPMFFEKNEGQTDPSVRFTARGRGYSLYLTPTQAVWCFQKSRRLPKGDRVKNIAPPKPEYLWMKLKGANPQCGAEGMEELPGKSNYFIGSSSHWHRNLSQYARVRFKEVYPHIDLVYYGNNGKLEYDFVVKPGGNPKDIQLKFEGAKDVKVDGNKGVDIRLREAGLGFGAPVLYQKEWTGKKHVAGRFSRNRDGEVGFEVEDYDPAQTLVIDPTLVYSTYAGASTGSDNEFCGLAVDPAGEAYLAEDFGSGFITTPGAIQTAPKALSNLLIFKLNTTATALIYATYLGGSKYDNVAAIAADSSGNAYVTGFTNSTDFPTTPGAFQTTMLATGGTTNPGNAFVAKINPTGTTLDYGTYLGGSVYENGQGIAVDSTGNAYITGVSDSPDFPVTPGAFQTAPPGLGNTFITKLNPAGSALVYSTYLGGGGGGYGIAVDSSGNAYITGATGSNFPVTPGAFQTMPPTGGCAFITKLNPAGSALVYSTFLNGGNFDYGQAIAVDSMGNAVVTGGTRSINFPTTPGAFQTALAAGAYQNIFVTKLNPTGTALVFSTYLGGNSQDTGLGIAVDGIGNVYVSGNTFSANFPTTPGAFQTSWGWSTGISITTFWSIFNPSGNLLYSTFWGGTASGLNSDEGAEIALDASGAFYVGGSTYATDFPITAGVYKTKRGPESEEMFVSKFVLSTATPTATVTSTPTQTPTPSATPSTTVTATPTATPPCQTHLWPDPFNPNYALEGTLKVGCLPPGAVVSFYTLSGEMASQSGEEGGMAQWDGRNRRGAPVSPGIYFYVIQLGNNTLGKGRFLVDR